MSDATHEQVPRDDPAEGRGRLLRVLGVVVLAALLVGGAAWMVGPEPTPADAGFPDAPPPLALPSDTDADSPLGRAAALLAAGQLDGARAGFEDVVALDQNGVAGQVGLVLSRWKTTGPPSVERDLTQLTAEYPESALAFLHLGLVQLLLGDEREARASLRSTLDVGRVAGDETSLRMASLADDLLHPDAFRGALPVLVQSSEVAAAQRPALDQLLVAVRDGDREASAKLAAGLTRSSDPMARVAGITATFDKDDPAAAVERLRKLAAVPSTPVATRDRARFLAALAELWGGGERAAGCRALASITSERIDAATRRLAAPVHAELCAGSAPA